MGAVKTGEMGVNRPRGQEVKRPREYRTKMVELQENRSWRKGSPGPGRRRRFRRGVGWELLGGATGTK